MACVILVHVGSQYYKPEFVQLETPMPLQAMNVEDPAALQPNPECSISGLQKPKPAGLLRQIGQQHGAGKRGRKKSFTTKSSKLNFATLSVSWCPPQRMVKACDAAGMWRFEPSCADTLVSPH